MPALTSLSDEGEMPLALGRTFLGGSCVVRDTRALFSTNA